MTAQIEVEDLHLHLGSSSGGTNALDGVSLHVNEGQRLGLVGGSGAGKSTLLKAMMALRQPDSGTVRFRGTSSQMPTLSGSFGDPLRWCSRIHGPPSTLV